MIGGVTAEQVVALSGSGPRGPLPTPEVAAAVCPVHATVLDGYREQTLGKTLLGIKVIREDTGAPPGPCQAVLRALTFPFVNMLVGLSVMLASPKRQRPGDDVAVGTLVVRKKGGSRE